MPMGSRSSIPQGAAAHVRCAVNPQLDDTGGVFCASSDIAELEDGKVTMTLEGRDSKVAPYAVDPASAERLWILSEAMTGASLPA